MLTSANLCWFNSNHTHYKPQNIPADGDIQIAYNDKVWNLKALCEELGLNYSTVHKRLRKYGWTLKKALDFKACEWILKDNK